MTDVKEVHAILRIIEELDTFSVFTVSLPQLMTEIFVCFLDGDCFLN